MTGVQDYLLHLFRLRRQQDAQQEASEAAEKRAQMLGLVESPGWKLLMDTLTPAARAVYDKLLDGNATPDERAFCRIVRLMQDGPEALIQMATQVLRDTRAS